MYSEETSHRRIQAVERALKIRIKRRSIAEVDERREKLEKLLTPKGLERDFTPTEKAFIRDERLLSKCSFRYWLDRYATAQRDDRLFIISQGASKVVYYVGGFLFFFVPGLHLTRGGMAWMLSSLWSSYTPQTYYLAVAAVVLSGVLSFFLLLLMTRLTIKLVAKVHYRWVSIGTLAVLLVIVIGMTGWGGLLICAVATGIGLIPVLWGSRRMNCMGVLLLPIALNMVGAGGAVAGWLGLI